MSSEKTKIKQCKLMCWFELNTGPGAMKTTVESDLMLDQQGLPYLQLPSIPVGYLLQLQHRTVSCWQSKESTNVALLVIVSFMGLYYCHLCAGVLHIESTWLWDSALLLDVRCAGNAAVLRDTSVLSYRGGFHWRWIQTIITDTVVLSLSALSLSTPGFVRLDSHSSVA